MSNTTPTVICIPAKPEVVLASKRQLRVAAYCRVSTDDEEQLTSYEAQKNYYTDKIMTNKEWTMAGIFADEGITGTSARKRPEFLRMIRQCKQGKIDIVLTKSISRFARNTVDCLNYVRALKELGIAVIFEKENMNTLEIDSEILITMLGAFAQSESESISANVRWGIRQAMKEGKATIQYKYLYGYRKGDDSKPEIIPDQAEVVRKIYDLFLSGTPVRGIQEYLNANSVPNINGESKWARSAIDSILTNEKYCGDVLLQKTYIDDCINKKVKKNTGQLPMYLVQNHHEGIISRETFDAAQAELARRSAGKSPSKKNAPTGRSRYSSKYALSDRLYCGECGTRYQRCTWRNRDGSKRIVWRCVSRVDYGSKYCHDSPTLDEEPLHRAILAAINSAVKDKDNIVYNLKSAMEKELAPVAGQQLSLSEIDSQLEQLNTEFSKALAEASESGDQAAYSDRFREIMQKQTALKVQRDEIQGMLAESGKAAAHIEQCRQAAETTPSAISEWDEALIRQVVESVTAETGSEIIVALKSGASIHQELL
ncbi:MAG: recombinase family protein [Candidatus Limivicinus sp.]